MSSRNSNLDSFSSALNALALAEESNPSTDLEMLANELEESFLSPSPVYYLPDKNSDTAIILVKSGAQAQQFLCNTLAYPKREYQVTSPSEGIISPCSKKVNLKFILSPELYNKQTAALEQNSRMKFPNRKEIRTKTDPVASNRIDPLVLRKPRSYTSKPGTIIKPSLFAQKHSSNSGENSPIQNIEDNQDTQTSSGQIQAESKKELNQTKSPKEVLQKFLEAAEEKRTPKERKFHEEKFFTTFSIRELRSFIQGTQC